MRVIHVCTIGPTARHLLLPQCEYLRQHGYEVGFVFSPDGTAADLRNAGFTVGEVFISRSITPADAWSVMALARYFRQVRPDIVHTHTSKGGAVGRLAARLAGVPHVVHTIHGFPFIEGQKPLKYGLFVRAERLLARMTDLLLSQSLEDVETARKLGIRARLGFPFHIGNGVDLRRFNPERFSAAEREMIRKQEGISEGPVIAMIGRMTAEKGHLDLISALAALRELPWSCLLIGPDEGLEAEVRRRLLRAGLDSRVRILGQRLDVDRLLAISDIYVLPSYREGVPRSVIEAQAMGLPAVVTNIRGCREVVQHGETGLLVEPGNPAQLARALGQLLQDAELRNRMGTAARLRAQALFDEQHVFKRILQSYSLLSAQNALRSSS